MRTSYINHVILVFTRRLLPVHRYRSSFVIFHISHCRPAICEQAYALLVHKYHCSFIFLNTLVAAYLDLLHMKQSRCTSGSWIICYRFAVHYAQVIIHLLLCTKDRCSSVISAHKSLLKYIYRIAAQPSHVQKSRISSLVTSHLLYVNISHNSSALAAHTRRP